MFFVSIFVDSILSPGDDHGSRKAAHRTMNALIQLIPSCSCHWFYDQLKKKPSAGFITIRSQVWATLYFLLSPDVVTLKNLRASGRQRLLNKLGGQWLLGHSSKTLKHRSERDLTDVIMVLYGQEFSSLQLTYSLPPPQRLSFCPFCTINPFVLFHPSFPFAWRSCSRFSKAHQAQCFSPV